MPDPTATSMPATVPASTATNPYGLTPGQYAFMQGLQGMGSSLNQQFGGGGYQFMRPNPGMVAAQGQQPTLLATILQMRANQAASLGQPFQPGTMPQMPRVSLLG
jgi:hypothetical protein